MSNNVAVIGTQWGDEGKGKIVDWLSEKADVIVRFQGGHNAGHTLVVNGIIYKFNYRHFYWIKKKIYSTIIHHESISNNIKIISKF